MKSFKEFLAERYKSEHEPHVRAIASQSRTAYFRDTYNYTRARGPIGPYDPVDLRRKFNHPNHFSRYGECGTLAFKAAHELRKHYPSAHVCSSWYNHPKKGKIDHCWVEIPEIGHFVDPSHDQMHNFEKHRKVAPTRQGNYPDSAVKVGSTDSQFYKSRYHGPVRHLVGKGHVTPKVPYNPEDNPKKKTLLKRIKGLFGEGLNESFLDRYWYHGTPSKNIDSIKRHGLKPASDCSICFAKKLGDQKPGVALRVHKKHLSFKERLSGFHTVDRTIPPEHIEMWHEGKWKRLTEDELKG